MVGPTFRQQGLTGPDVVDALLGPTYELNLSNPALSSAWDSFKFAAP